MPVLLWMGYSLVFCASFFGVSWWDRRKRKTKPPLPENLKLLRMPGEYLWRRVIRSGDSTLQWLLVVITVPPLVGAGAMQIVTWYFGSFSLLGVVLTLMALVFSLLLSVRRLQRRLERQEDDYLGFIGERYVAEGLDPLKAQGWFIFHDIQCAGATGKFNLDHVAIGPGGVWVVETKTRRKGRARPGFKEHEATSDGRQIVWPWGEDSAPLKQASDGARWLRDWLAKLTGKAFDVAAVVAVPGYYVVEKSLGPVRLANPKVLPQVLISRGKNVLRDEDIDLIRRQLEEKCRDVEF